MINNIPKRHFYNEQDYELDFDECVLKLKPELHQKLLEKKLWNKFGFKKIGGSSVGDVLEVDEFKSSFAAFCRMSWCDLPILDKKYVNAGVAIEPKVIDVLRQVMKKDIQTFDPKLYDYDYFKDQDDIIGGIPDGYVNEDRIILEIKTTGVKNYEKWEQYGVPQGYLKQAQIYAYLMKVEKFWIVATFLEEDDYLNPYEYPIEKRKIKNYKYLINEFQVQDDITKIKKWYINHTQSGISPKWNLKKDSDLLEYLKCKNENEYLELLEKWKLEGKFIDE